MIKTNHSNFYLLLFLAFIIIAFRIPLLDNNVLTWDVFGYYLYLPAHFIYKDLELIDYSWLHRLQEQYEFSTSLYQISKIDNGNSVIKYTFGVSLLSSPFFFIANAIAEPLGYIKNGLSAPYQVAMTFSGIFYAIVGLVLWLKVLLKFFNKKIAYLSLLLIFLGTNYFQLTIFDGILLTHNFLFTFYALLIYSILLFKEKASFFHAGLLGFSIGMIVLLRPSEAVCILIPAIWLFPQFFSSGRFAKNWIYIPFICLLALLTFSPQIIYWKIVTGDYFFYSYTNAGEGLDFDNPHLLSFLFSFKKGWLLYTPLIVLSFLGFKQLYKHNRPPFYAILSFVVVNVYVISCWTNWWYAGGSFSSRSIVPAYVALAIPLGYFLKSISSWSTLNRTILFSFIAFCLTLNLLQTWQFERGILSQTRMTKDYYLAIFGKIYIPKGAESLLSIDRTLPVNDMQKFDNYTKRKLDVKTYPEYPTGKNLIYNKNTFSESFQASYKELTKTDHCIIQAELEFSVNETSELDKIYMVFMFMHEGKAYSYTPIPFSTKKIQPGEKNQVTFNYLSPVVRSETDSLDTYIWNTSNSGAIKLRKMQMNVLEPKADKSFFDEFRFYGS